MLEVALDALFTIFALRAIWKLMQGVVAGMSEPTGARPSSRTPPPAPPHGVQMARDPICGTYVVPERAICVRDGRQPVYFCSDACRDKYRAKTA